MESKKSLKQLLEERDRLWRETGRYWGVEELTLQKGDPIKYNIFVARLFTAAMSARETCKYISASPASRQMGEEVFAVTTPEGDVTAISMGLNAHVALAHRFIRTMIERGFEEDPGIRDGDIFSCNNPKYVGLHAADVYTGVPIFYEGEIIGWTVGINHIHDVGCMESSSNATFSPTSFVDGLQMPPWRVGENFKHYPWVYDLWESRTRAGTFNILDEKMRLSGCLVLRDRIFDIIKEFGIDYYKRVSREWIEDGRRYTIAAIKRALVPGVYRDPWFYDLRQKGLAEWFSYADRNWLLHSPGHYSISTDARMTADMEGANSQDFHCFHTYPHGAAWGTFFKQIRDRVVWDPRVCAAITLIFDVQAPEGCIYNPDYPFTATSAACQIASCFHANTAVCTGLGWFARGYLEETQPNSPSTLVPAGWGNLADGTPYAILMFEGAAQMSGAGYACADGEHCVFSVAADACDCGDAEDMQYTMPTLFYLNRGLEPNTCGHGKFRGGASMTKNMVVLEPGQFFRLNCWSSANAAVGGHFPRGLPGAYDIAVHLKNTNFRELANSGAAFPRNWREARMYLDKGLLKAEEVKVYKGPMPEHPVHDGDMLFFIHGAGMGWGDPIEREPELATKDVENGDLTPDFVGRIYGIVLDKANGGWKVNREATERTRARIREQRKKEAIPVREWWRREREKVLNRDFGSVEEVKDMHRDCLRWAKYREEFTAFWQVGEDFSI